MSDCLQHNRLGPARLLRPWDSPDKNTGVGCHVLQGIFPTQDSSPGLLCLLHRQAGSSPLVPGRPYSRSSSLLLDLFGELFSPYPCPVLFLYFSLSDLNSRLKLLFSNLLMTNNLGEDFIKMHKVY